MNAACSNWSGWTAFAGLAFGIAAGLALLWIFAYHLAPILGVGRDEDA